ncbi:MAG TPA: hypothetical protein VMU19_04755 [Bryobacteraceae bacterium]|nr:hypothetical protein [Bryobacteraceae bacterium]
MQIAVSAASPYVAAVDVSRVLYEQFSQAQILELLFDVAPSVALAWFLLCLYREWFHGAPDSKRRTAAWVALLFWSFRIVVALVGQAARLLLHAGRWGTISQVSIRLGSPLWVVVPLALAWVAFLSIFQRRRQDARTPMARSLAGIACAATVVEGLAVSYAPMSAELRFWPKISVWAGTFPGWWFGLLAPAALLANWILPAWFLYACSTEGGPRRSAAGSRQPDWTERIVNRIAAAMSR